MAVARCQPRIAAKMGPDTNGEWVDANVYYEGDCPNPKTAKTNGKCETDGVTNKGIIESARIKAALAAAILAINTRTALQMAELQYDLAKDYARLAENWREHYEKNYEPLEIELTKEVDTIKPYDRKKDDLIKGQMMVTAKIPLTGRIEKQLACTGRYCTGLRASMLNSFLLERAAIEATVCGLAHRTADSEQDVRDALRWERRSNVLKLGRDIPTEAVSYAQLATGIFGSIGNQAAQGAGAMAWYLGHRGERLDTVYNTDRGPLTIANVQYDHEIYDQRKNYFPKGIDVKPKTTPTVKVEVKDFRNYNPSPIPDVKPEPASEPKTTTTSAE